MEQMVRFPQLCLFSGEITIETGHMMENHDLPTYVGVPYFKANPGYGNWLETLMGVCPAALTG